MARVGGDEFAWLMPETGGDGGLAGRRPGARGDRRRALPGVGQLTISAGVCDLDQAREQSELFRLADGALYWAKQHGRDVAFLYSPEVVEVLSDAEHAERLTRLQALQSIRVLARAVDAKDPSTRQHSERVAEVAQVLAEIARLDRPTTPSAAARRRPRPRRRQDRRARRHPLQARPAHPGRVPAASRPTPPSARRSWPTCSRAAQVAWVRGHHERWDGRGYPDGLAGEAIPEGARILTLADAWDVMTSERPYGVPLSREDALAECRRCSGAQFWPAAVEALERALAEGLLPPGAVRDCPAYAIARGRGSWICKGNAVTWLGHGTWLWETSEGKRLLIDTWLAGNPATPDEYKDPAALKPDGILITHGHFDHIGQGGAEAVDAITQDAARPPSPCSRSRSTSGGKGVEVTGFNIGGSVEVAGVTATMVTARPLGRDHRRRRHDGLRRRRRSATCSRSRTAWSSTRRATPTCSATWP